MQFTRLTACGLKRHTRPPEAIKPMKETNILGNYGGDGVYMPMPPAGGIAGHAPGTRVVRNVKRAHSALCEQLAAISLACDTVVIVSALLFSYWLRFRSPL